MGKREKAERTLRRLFKGINDRRRSQSLSRKSRKSGYRMMDNRRVMTWLNGTEKELKAAEPTGAHPPALPSV
jgi:hypothetical protein